MYGYRAQSGVLDLGTTASGSVIFALNNPSTTKSAFVKRLLAMLGFVGTPAATGIDFGICRATGTAAAGSGNASGSSIAKNGGGPDSFCTVRWGPTPITGLTPDAPGDFAGAFLNHQIEGAYPVEIIRDDLREQYADEFILLPSTSLIVITRTISIVGSRVAFNVEWAETI